MSLEGLQPHTNLKELLLESYGGVKFSNWLSSFTNLELTELQNCQKFQHLLPLDQFHSLRKLQLIGSTSLDTLLRHRGATFWAPRHPRSGAEAPRCPNGHRGA
ncbi:hypothetical protein TorRG33x02_075310 [Trema orientale]|uniref:R13L1/DRL21-like LRR repeat region domain-containing protein n=1 Tax=Trema orientale TaxID=63057 RepID=A0A2P5FFH6_TREOI|nr:hypothetical protein TorRG33x02_075310 [Trema orientale]